MVRAIGRWLLGSCLVASTLAASHVGAGACRQAAFSSVWTPRIGEAAARLGGRGRSQGSWNMMAKKAQKTGRKPVAKGFGAQPKLKVKGAEELIDPTITALCDWLKAGSCSISKVAIADFQGLRGVAARQVIEQGEAIVSIPMDMAINLGSDGINPGYAAARLCEIEKSDERRAAGWFQPFLDILPTYEECDTTDFFSDAEIDALEWPIVKEETEQRMRMLRSAYEARSIRGLDKVVHEDFSFEEYMWGVYQVVSRVLSISDSSGMTKYLIPMIDMFNHDPKSEHSLKCTQGQFKVIAGKRIKEGEQINIVYGGGVLNSDRLMQDYGFVQEENEYDVKQLVLPAAKEPMPGLPFLGMGCDVAKLNEMLSGFSTTLDEDLAKLASGSFESKNMRAVLSFRIAKKRAIMAALDRLS